jgi:excinuclease ABC subunit C
MDNSILNILVNLPEEPGIYQFFNHNGDIIYVGKAKNLKKRVSSYFHQKHTENRKLYLLVRKIANIKFIIVDSEQDALLLENNLIKEHQPRYNFLLKDDKSFPWICIKNENFPRVFSTRNIIKDGSQYFGPYTSGSMVKTLLELIHKLFPIRTCTLNINFENVKNKKFKICLEYHLKNCKGPCEDLMTTAEYNDNLTHIKYILKGNIFQVLVYLKELMNNYSILYKFEEANIVKGKIELLEKFQSKSTIVNPSINNIDVFSIYREGDIAAVNYLKVIDGAVLIAHNIELNLKLDETDKEILLFSILELRQRFQSDSPELLVPFEIGYTIPGLILTIPKIGDKKKLLELSERNSKFYLLNLKKRKSEIVKENPINQILLKIKSDLRLNDIPVTIECFDNSNIQGTNPVAACVVFKNAKPYKSEYRHFNIKTVSGPDDFSSMEEVIYRRYKRSIDEKKRIPNLIIIDGGKGQLNAAMKSLQKLQLNGKVAIIGIAKKLEEIYFPGDSLPIYLDKTSVTLRVIQHIRNEAHRFGISFHRDKRSSTMIQSSLETLPGIGSKTIQILLNYYKALNALKHAEKTELCQLIGVKRANIILNFVKEFK